MRARICMCVRSCHGRVLSSLFSVPQSYAGMRKVDPSSARIHCMVESEPSNTLPVMCPAPPQSPTLRLEGMHTEGIDITWEMPQQYGDAAVSVRAGVERV